MLQCVVGSAAAYGNGCAGGWHQYDVDKNFPANGGLNLGSNGMGPDTINYLLGVKALFPCITFADLATFVGALGPELAGGECGSKGWQLRQGALKILRD